MFLYKYLPAERIDVLENLKIRFTQAGSLNDPFELKPYFPSLLSEGFYQRSLNEEFRKIYDSEGYSKLVSYDAFISQVRYLIPTIEKEFKELGSKKLDYAMSFLHNSIGILSLSENLHNLLMWSHYANSHTGFVIALDSEHSFFSEIDALGDRQYFDCGKVKYSFERLHVTVDELEDSRLLFWKPDCWSYEAEWRFVKKFQGQPDFLVGEDKVFLFDIPPACIQGVYCGANMSSFDIDKIKDLVKSERLSHVDVNQMKLCEKEFALEVEALS